MKQALINIKNKLRWKEKIQACRKWLYCNIPKIILSNYANTDSKSKKANTLGVTTTTSNLKERKFTYLSGRGSNILRFSYIKLIY